MYYQSRINSFSLRDWLLGCSDDHVRVTRIQHYVCIRFNRLQPSKSQMTSIFLHVTTSPKLASFPGSSPAFCSILYYKKLGRNLGIRLAPSYNHLVCVLCMSCHSHFNTHTKFSFEMRSTASYPNQAKSYTATSCNCHVVCHSLHVWLSSL